MEEVAVGDREVETASEDEGRLIRPLIQTPPAVTKEFVAVRQSRTDSDHDARCRKEREDSIVIIRFCKPVTNPCLWNTQQWA